MSGKLAGFLEMTLVFGGLLAVLVFELMSVRRSQRRDGERKPPNKSDDQHRE